MQNNRQARFTMRERLKKPNFHYVFYISFVLILLILVVYENVMPAEREDYKEQFTVWPDTWYRVLPDGTTEPLVIPSGVANPYEEEGSVIIESVIPYKIYTNSWLMMRSSQETIKFYVDGAFRAAYDTSPYRLSGENAQSGYAFCEIYPSDMGKTIQIDISVKSLSQVKISTIYYGDKFSLWMWLISNCALELILTAFMTILAVVCICGGAIFHIRYQKNHMLESLGWLALFSSMIVICESHLRQLLFPNTSIVADTTYYLITLMSMSLMTFVNKVQHERYDRLYTILCYICIFDIMRVNFSVNFNITEYFTAGMITILYETFVVGVILVTMILDIKRGFFKEYKEIGIATIIFIVSEYIGNFYVNVLMKGGSIGLFFSAGIFVLIIGVSHRTFKDIVNIERDRQRAISDKVAKEHLFANISHEIRTPLNGILGINEMILRESADPEVTAHAKTIRNSGRMILTLVNDLLDFSKAEAGKLIITPSDYSPDNMIIRCIELIEESVREKGLEIKYDIDEQMPTTLYGDEIRISQVLTNILSNAVKYTKHGFITIHAHTLPSPEAGMCMLNISVEDTGQGIRKENLQYLFDSYTRFEEKENANIQGTGLGLGIVKYLIQQMSGTIDVSSEYGKGSIFSFVIPQKVTDSAPAGSFTELRNRRDTVEPHTGRTLVCPGASLLIVDDNPINIMVLKSMLQNSKMTINTANSGQACLELSRKQRYNLILMDHMMPEMSGVETMKQLRSDRESLNRSTRVIALTANVSAGIREEYLEYGFDDYLSKPVSPDTLNSLLLSFLPDAHIQ